MNRSPDNQVWQLAEAYLANNMAAAERKALEEQLKEDKAFAALFQEALDLLGSLQQSGAQHRFTANLKSISSGLKEETVKAPRKISLKHHYLRTAAVAAGVALLASVATSRWNARSHENASRYSELRKEMRSDIEDIRQSQNKIINDLNKKANKPAIENKYSGTGFALSNEGYLVTNYHVTEGADSIYIQTRDGNYYKAYTVSFDAAADIAVLKVEGKNFRFSKTGQIPYSFAGTKSLLGEQVYTLGYPQDEVVYSEGYISSRNGYMGDSVQYRLELPAEPGQSGAPVLDPAGNIVAIVTGKESNTEGTTYAVSSKAMLKLLKNMPQASAIHLPKTNKLSRLNRTQQIEKIQDFTCVVKVYKK